MTETKNPPTAARSPRAKRSPWRSTSLWVALVVTLVGLGLWAYAAATTPKTAGGSGAPAGMVSGLTGGDPLAAPAPEPRLIDKASPAVARFGACFVAGFCIAYAFKKFIKVTALITGVFLIAMFALQKTNVINLDWAWVQDGFDRSLAWLKGEAGAMKEFILGYLPSSASALAGIVVGLRKG
jgi:uncharacterized membrane protein (Fun14 family)